MTPRCPVHCVAVATGYTKRKCRCEACVEWNRANSEKNRRKPGYRAARREEGRVWRAKVRKAQGKPLTDRMIGLRYADFFKEADAALRIDPELIIAIARDAAAARELHDSGNSVSA